MLWVAKYFIFSSPGLIWKIFSVPLHYGKLSVLGKLETRLEKRALGKVQLEDSLHHLEKEELESLAFTKEQLCFIWCLLQQIQAEDCYQKSRQAFSEAHGRR